MAWRMAFANIPDSVDVFGVQLPGIVVVIGAVVVVCACCCVCCGRFCRTESNVTKESFKWPSSSKFLSKVDPGDPPKLIVEKYEDPIRTDVIPWDTETHWAVRYQPHADRPEATQRMYLRFREGAVYGIGYEDYRKLCKISGKYKHDAGANQTALAMTCKFSNECDTVMFHGWGNGTALVGNFYVRELNPFNPLSVIPGLNKTSLGSITYRGSFLMMKMSGMGDTKLRARLHSRRVHKWAGSLYPDDSEPMPRSPMHANGAYAHVGGAGGGVGAPRSPPASLRRPRGKSARGGGGKKKFFGLLPSSGKRKPSMLQPATSPRSTPSSPANEHPPWDRPESQRDGDDAYGAPTTGARRPSVLPPHVSLNYLQVDGVPGRSGPAMV